MLVEKKGKCGLNCEDCPYFGRLCTGCVIESCLVDHCIRGTSYTGITHPTGLCVLRPYCPIGGKVRPSPTPPPYMRKKSMKKIDFPSFIPEIDLFDQKSWLWEEGVQTPIVSVPLWQLITNKSKLSQALDKGLHDYLGFGGKILLSTIMPDELIDRLKKNDYFELINDLKPDATMIPDNYTYTDMPLYQSWSQTIKLVTFANDFLDLGVSLIGMIKGANLQQVYWSFTKEIEAGYVSFAMPIRELFEEERLDEFLPYIIQTIKERRNKDFELVLYGIGQRLKGYRDISYSNLSWFLRAKRGEYYKDGLFYDLRDPSIRFEECYCDACKGIMPQDIIDLWFENKERALKILAIHNFLDLGRKWKR
ncbi:MAG: hypothetical protein ACPLN2_01920 [Thermoproteota archaeon]